jgi:hypothetical protein
VRYKIYYSELIHVSSFNSPVWMNCRDRMIVGFTSNCEISTIFRLPALWGVLDKTLCDQVCQCLTKGGDLYVLTLHFILLQEIYCSTFIYRQCCLLCCTVKPVYNGHWTWKYGLYEQLSFIYRLKLYALFINRKNETALIRLPILGI